MSTPATKADIQALNEKLDLVFFTQATVLAQLKLALVESMQEPYEKPEDLIAAVTKEQTTLKAAFAKFQPAAPVAEPATPITVHQSFRPS